MGYSPGAAPTPPSPTNVYVQSPNVPFIREDEGKFQYMVGGKWKGIPQYDPPEPPDPPQPPTNELPNVVRIEFRPGEIQEWELTQKEPFAIWEQDSVMPQLFLRLHLDKPAPANCYLQIWRRSKRNRERDPSWPQAPPHMNIGDKRLVRYTINKAFRPIGFADGQRGDVVIEHNPDAGFPVISIPEGATIVQVPEWLNDRPNPRLAEDAFFVPKVMRSGMISNPKYADRLITSHDSKCIMKFGTAVWIPGCGFQSWRPRMAR